jgi:hypothetical protein
MPPAEPAASDDMDRILDGALGIGKQDEQALPEFESMNGKVQQQQQRTQVRDSANCTSMNCTSGFQVAGKQT